MKHSTKPPTEAESARMSLIKSLGCIACYKEGLYNCGPVENHHILSGNRRKGHAFTIPLGSYHHRGESLRNCTATEMADLYGPSLARQSKKFRERYGSEQELLELTNKLIGDGP